ncbi:hypothetical protein Acr_28g0011350 [Actinidia rufa]|uniref:Uncharacterized protein n=1 Tax=Actinidia rufa TaxID=165716 RepID=A0A7J0HBE6_9ERIC|nr:hypothetical protein Acr_28g0011350 [Actinidia rufa]
MHLHTEVPAPSHRGALHPPPGRTTPPTGVRRKVRHFASCRGSISPPLCAQLERTPPLIKSRAKETRFGVAAPSLYSFSKSTWSPSSELLYGHPALVASLVSGQTSVHIPKHLPALLYHSGSSRYPCACFAYLCATVTSLVHSPC